MQERKLMELAEAAGTIAIVGHVRPDGDCVGSCLAVCNYITEQYPEKDGRCLSGDSSGKIFLFKAV